MAEQKMTYPERWHELANEYAVAHGNGNLGVHRINLYYEKDARIAVAAQAEAIREALNILLSDQLFSEMQIVRYIDKYLLEHGYIEPKTDVIASEYAKQAESRCIPKNDKSTLQIIKDATERTGIEPKTYEDDSTRTH